MEWEGRGGGVGEEREYVVYNASNCLYIEIDI